MPISFEPTTTRFSAANAEALALASLIVYQEPEAARQLAASELGLDQFYEPFEHHNFAIDTQGFVAAGKKHVVLAFRGTEPNKFKDWATDVLATPGEFRWFFERAPDVGTVHAGFANSLRDAWADDLRRLLKKTGAGTRRTLWITGHSLGGALAVMAGAACIFDPETLLPVYGLYTFGQPRVGLREFCTNFERQLGRFHYRFVNDRDVVPRVPPRSFDYVHTGRLIHFDSKGNPTVDSHEHRSFLARAFQTMTKVVDDFLKAPELVADHNMEKGYIKSIRAASLAPTDSAGSWMKALPSDW